MQEVFGSAASSAVKSNKTFEGICEAVCCSFGETIEALMEGNLHMILIVFLLDRAVATSDSARILQLLHLVEECCREHCQSLWPLPLAPRTLS